jgi:hypothetical protein
MKISGGNLQLSVGCEVGKKGDLIDVLCVPQVYFQYNRKQINIFGRKVYRRILGPVYDN